MRDIKFYSFNVVSSARLSEDKFKKFSELHIARLSQNNPNGTYTEILNSAITLHQIYFGAISDEDIKFSIQQGLTITKDNLFKQFIASAKDAERTVLYHFKKGSSEYQEFYPHGLTEYHIANVGNIEVLMARFISACQKYKDKLTGPLLDNFILLRDNYYAARTAQTNQMGVVQGSRNASDEAREAIEKQLMVNMLTIAKDYVGDPAGLMVYFDQSFISKEKEDDEPIPE